jgi:2,4-dienoyl-CoA reductase-like NADH-dependent reductase (Old Yellow Enzyme family)
MSGAFEPYKINSLVLRNRFVRSATWEGLADLEGRVTDRLIAMLTTLAENDVGLVISGYAYVRSDGQAAPFQTGIHHDDLIPGLKHLADSVHRAGGRLAVQIAHGGVQSIPELTGVRPAMGPSDFASEQGRHPAEARAMEVSEIREMAAVFGKAAARAKKAGCDAVQLHVAHAYIFNQFLSPYFNKRTDRYGGDLANRARFLNESYEAIRGEVGPDFPVMMKINCEDFLDGGLTLEDSIAATKALADMGLDAVEISGGTPYSGPLTAARKRINAPEKEAYFRYASEAFKARMNIPVMLVGGIRTLPVAEDVLNRGQADLIALCRPLIREPNLIKRWADGDAEAAACISCSGCYAGGIEGHGVHCAIMEKNKANSSDGEHAGER